MPVLKDNWRFISRIERVADNVIIVFCFFLAYICRDAFVEALHYWGVFSLDNYFELGQIEIYYVVLLVGLPLYNAILSLLGAYQSMRYRSFLFLLRVMVVTSLLVFFIETSVLYLFKLDLSRTFIGAFCFLSCLFLFLERWFVLRSLRYWRSQGKNYRNLLVVGLGDQATKVYREIQKQPELGIKIAGFVVLQGDKNPKMFCNHPVIVAEDFEAALKRFAIDEVLFTEALARLPEVEPLARIAVEEGVRVSMSLNLFGLEILNSEVSSFASLPLVHYQPGPSASGSLLLKRWIDIGLSSTSLVVLSPAFLVVSVVIKLTSKGPIFYRQKRVGLNGRIFTLYKFRSMVVNADKMLEELADQNEMSGPVFKVKDDPRITQFGRFIRKYSIDELPQLFNVLRGDMSLVGPRPPLPDEVSEYMRKQRRRLSMRPGLTCIWQVSGRNQIPDFDTWAKLDLEYIDNWSLKKDFELMLRTIPVVLSGSGAS